MTSRERILTTLSHKEPDRCPTYSWLNDDTQEQLERHLGVRGLDGLEAALGIDRWRPVALPVRGAEKRGERIRKLVPDEYLGAAGVLINSYGCVTRIHPGAAYLEDFVWVPLQEARDPSEIDTYAFETFASIGPVDGAAAEVERLKAEGAVVTGSVSQPFKIACILRGMENFMCDLLVHEAIANRIYDHLYGYATACGVALAEAGVDVVQIFGDIAMQDRLMISPDTWRQFDKPRLAELITQVKAANPEVYLFMHSDGKMDDIIPDLIEVGLDILNPIQPECQDPVEVKKKWGNRLVLHGTVSNQRTVPMGTPQEVKDEVKRLLDHCSKGGGLVIGPSNVLLAEFPTENIVALYDAVTEYYTAP